MAELNLFDQEKGATFSDDRVYRYTLWRIWDDTKPRLCVIGLNPSTADENVEDPTIRRCINYAKAWGMGSLMMLNLFAFRSTDPKGLMAVVDTESESHFRHELENNQHIRREAVLAYGSGGIILAAWGNWGGLNARGDAVRAMLEFIAIPLHYLRLTKDGHPGHPLYLPANLTPVKWEW